MKVTRKLDSDEREYIFHYEAMANICHRRSWGDPHSYARSKEMYAAFLLGHHLSSTLSGADAYNENNEPLEYKSTIDKAPKGAYTGISVQPTWEQQEQYLINDKIGKYPEHYYNRFDRAAGLVESWKLLGRKVLELLLPKVKKQYSKTHAKKDPRIHVNITPTEIKKYGEQVI